MAKKTARKATRSKKYVSFKGRMVMIGFGSIGQGVLPLILRHIGIKPAQITIIAEDLRGGMPETKRYGVSFIEKRLTQRQLPPDAGQAGWARATSWSTSRSRSPRRRWSSSARRRARSTSTPASSRGRAATPIPSLSVSRRSNYALRDTMLKLKPRYRGGPTAVIAHGANPGLVSHFVKQALMNLARDTGVKAAVPSTREGWGKLARRLGVKVIHIAERDTQVSPDARRKWASSSTPGRSTASSRRAASRPRWAGARTRRRCRPTARATGSAATPRSTSTARACSRACAPGRRSRGRSTASSSRTTSRSRWPTTSRVRDGKKVVYRPTVHYAYHPVRPGDHVDARDRRERTCKQQKRQRLIVDEITSGRDELGVLLMGHKKGAYWYGSQLDIHETRKLAPYNNATSIQVCAPVLSGIIWALENPDRGLVEADEMDFARNLEICMPYLGPVVGKYSDWTPLQDRGVLFPEDLDKSDPWQFKNFRVS